VARNPGEEPMADAHSYSLPVSAMVILGIALTLPM
jgi:hypothetical protein